MVLIDAQCIPCILHVRARELSKYISDRRSRVEFMSKLAVDIANYAPNDMNIAEIATRSFRKLKEYVGDNDPYIKEKEIANEVAERILKNIGKEKLNNFSFLLKLATIGNSIDFGVLGYEFSVENVLEELKKAVFRINDESKLLKYLDKSKTLVYLLDNAGEAVFDRELIRFIAKKYRKMRIYVVVKSGSFQNDITFNEALRLGFLNIGDNVMLLETGTDASSIFLDEITSELLNILVSSDLIIAKGMAHYEYLGSKDFKLKKNIVFMLKAKCSVIASSLDTGLGEYVIKFVANINN